MGGGLGGAAGAAGEAGFVVASPDEVALELDAEGAFGPTRWGLRGQVRTSAGKGSEITVELEDGGMCLEGVASVVQDNDWFTYFGAEATFSLCEEEEGELTALGECLPPAVMQQVVGVAFTVTGEELPWLYRVRFNERDRQDSAEVRLQEEGEVMAFFTSATDPRDSLAPPVDAEQVISISVRASGYPTGEVPFDFCIGEIRLLLGEEWKEAGVPEWIHEDVPGKTVRHVGANLVGAEFGEQNLPGTHGSDYIYPSREEVAQYVERGMNTFRVPFRWERMQQSLYGELDDAELGYLQETVDAVLAFGGTIVLDPHNFARYVDDGQELVIGEDLEIEAFADLWARLSAVFGGQEGIWFGLMNEPHSMPTETWLEAANVSITAIRNAGATNKILVPGNQYTGAHAWFESYYGTPNSEVLIGVEDPQDNFAIEVHQYFDSDSSGTSDDCVSEGIGVSRVREVTSWLENEGLEGFLGEFGGSDDEVCLKAMDNLLTHLGDHADVWLGWSAWAATRWNIQHNIRPQGQDDVLQMRVLKRHMDQP